MVRTLLSHEWRCLFFSNSQLGLFSLQRLAYCNGCSCKNCHNTKEHDDKRQQVRATFFRPFSSSHAVSFEFPQAIERIKERNPNAFNKPVAGGTQRKCKCKRSQCLKKYCECFQAGLPCLPECVCVSCHNFEGSDMRTRALAGEELDLKPSRHRHDLDDEDRIDDDDEGEVLVDVKPRPRRATRRKVTAVYDEASDGGGAGEDDDEPAYAPGSPARGGGGGGLVVPSFGGLSFDAPPISRPGALPVRLPAGSTRSFRNQLVRLDLCSFISSSIHPFCNMLMLGTEANARASAKAEGTVKREVAVKAEDNEDKMDLRASMFKICCFFCLLIVLRSQR